MANSHSTATPEATKTSAIAHPPVPDVQKASQPKIDRSGMVGTRAIQAIGGGSPETSPEQYAGSLGQLSGRSQTGMLRQLQRSYGNSYVGRVIQAKLTVNQPGDIYEQEADRMAAQVMNIAAPQSDHSIQREIESKKQKEKIQMMPSLQLAADGNREVGGNLENQLNSSKGGGSPLPNEVRSFMEPRFGADLSQVRVHTGGEAVQMNRELGAQAFTHGSDVYFGAGKSPGNNELTAHELTHVVQQTGALQRKCAACQEEDDRVMRKENEESSASTSSKSDASQSSNTTAKLLDLIARLEQLHAHSDKQIVSQASAESTDNATFQKEGQEHLDTLSNGLEQLRAVASSNDETLKQRVLAAFTPSAMQTAQAQASTRVQATSGSSLPSSSAAIVQRAPVSIATKSLTISSQHNATEIEADQVAKMVTSGKSVTVSEHSPEGSVNRFSGGEELIALGSALLAADAEASLVEAAAGPPGWAIGLGVAAVAVVAIGIGYAISSSTDSEPVTTPAPGTTAAPIPVPTAAPIPVPFPVPVSVPVTVSVSRSFPDQTCENDRMAELERIMHGICDQGFSCSDTTEKLGRKKEELLSKEQLLKNIALAEACLKARQDVQDECFKNSTNDSHKKPLKEVGQALKTCQEKYKARYGSLP